MRDFPGGPVVGNLSANAGDTGSIPGPGGSHMPQSRYAHGPELLKPKRPQEEKPLTRQLEKSCNRRRRPSAVKNIRK